MPRPYWKGAVSFGLVNVPVSLYSATRRLDFQFHLYHDYDCPYHHEEPSNPPWRVQPDPPG